MEPMPRFEIIYSDEPTTKALFSESIVARDRVEANNKAMGGFQSAQLKHGARCYRVVDGLGMVVTRGPNAAITRTTE
jgi:hypothetical protein